MIKKFSNIISILMVLILFAPSIIKLEHRHEHFVCNAKSEKHLHAYHEKCTICSFEFSLFCNENICNVSANVDLNDNYRNCFNACYYFDFSNYSFLLRAPPVYTSIA